MWLWSLGTCKDTQEEHAAVSSPGGTAVSDPADLGAAPDALGTLLPQGLGAPQPQRAHPRESRGRKRVRPKRFWLGVGLNQWGEAEERKAGPLCEVIGPKCPQMEAGAGQHSWEKQLRGQQRAMEQEAGNMLPEVKRQSRSPESISFWKNLGEPAYGIHIFSILYAYLFISGESRFQHRNPLSTGK